MATVTSGVVANDDPLSKNREGSQDGSFTAVNEKSIIGVVSSTRNSGKQGPRITTEVKDLGEFKPETPSTISDHDRDDISMDQEISAKPQPVGLPTNRRSPPGPTTVIPQKRKFAESNPSSIRNPKSARDPGRDKVSEKDSIDQGHQQSGSIDSHTGNLNGSDESYVFLRQPHESNKSARPSFSAHDQPNGDADRAHTWNYASQESPASQAVHRDSTEVRLAEALTDQNYTHDTSHWNGSDSPPTDDAGSRQPYHYQTDEIDAQNHRDPPRKRKFTNRTKTGCMTCRRRKKKCDEGKPYCNNCLRGQFACEGYQARVIQKAIPSRPPLPLQSKTGYQDPYSRNGGMEAYSPDNGSLQGSHSAETRLQSSDTNRTRPPVVIDEERDASSFIQSPTASTPRTLWPAKVSGPPFGGTANGPLYPESLSRSDFRDVSLPRPDRMPSFPELNNAHTPQNPRDPFHPRYQSNQSALNTSGLAASTTQASATTAQRVLEQVKDYPQRPPTFPSGEPSGNSVSQKRLMHAGKSFYPYYLPLKNDKRPIGMISPSQLEVSDLVELRERCAKALWNFNNNPYQYDPSLLRRRCSIVGGRRQLFLDVIQPESRPNEDPLPSGSVGDNTIIESPFHCDYGYNIHIGNGVLIGRNCSFRDAGRITIGDNVAIEANVSILGAMISGMATGSGSGVCSQMQSMPVKIESSCIISTGAVIMPGVTLKAGTYVGPNEVINQETADKNTPWANIGKLMKYHST